MKEKKVKKFEEISSRVFLYSFTNQNTIGYIGYNVDKTLFMNDNVFSWYHVTNQKNQLLILINKQLDDDTAHAVVQFLQFFYQENYKKDQGFFEFVLQGNTPAETDDILNYVRNYKKATPMLSERGLPIKTQKTLAKKVEF